MPSITIDHLGEFIRMYKSHLKVKGTKFTRLADDAKDICKITIDSLYKKGFFHTGFNNYPQFWCRDFGMMVPSLLKLGYNKEVLSTLTYALNIFSAQNKITTHITPGGKAINFPNKIAPDTLAYFFLSLRRAKATSLVKKHKTFLQSQLNIYTNEILNEKGLVKRHTHFSSMRDHAVRDASCYDTVMVAVCKREAHNLGLVWNAAEDLDYEKVLIKEYWMGSYFRDNMSEKKLSADANIYPFWHGIIKDKTMLKDAVKSMQRIDLDKPFPIKYVKNKKSKGKMIWVEKLVSDWEADSVWPMSGLPYIDVLRNVDKKQALHHLNQYKDLMEQYGTFLEVYDRFGNPFSSPFFSCDEGMIWCALWLILWKELS